MKKNDLLIFVFLMKDNPEATNAFSEIDRKNLEKVRANVAELEKMRQKN